MEEKVIDFDTKKLGRILHIILIVGLVLFIPCFIMAPFLLKNNSSDLFSCLFLYPNGILMCFIIIEFMKLFKALEDDSPFTYENVNTLFKTGTISFIMSILWIVDLIGMIFIVHNTYINYIIVLLFLFLLFFGVGIALYILSLLFKKATEYKIENDLTI